MYSIIPGNGYATLEINGLLCYHGTMNKVYISLAILLLAGLTLWFYRETVLEGIFPEYGVEPYEISQEGKTCKPGPAYIPQSADL